MGFREFINLISFCISMQNNKGILAKSPRYVMEKYLNKCPGILDYPNKNKLTAYCKKWDISLKKMKGYPGD